MTTQAIWQKKSNHLSHPQRIAIGKYGFLRNKTNMIVIKTTENTHLFSVCVPTSNDRISTCGIQSASALVELKCVYSRSVKRLFLLSHHKWHCDFSPLHSMIVRMTMRVPWRWSNPGRHLAFLPVTFYFRFQVFSTLFPYKFKAWRQAWRHAGSGELELIPEIDNERNEQFRRTVWA